MSMYSPVSGASITTPYGKAGRLWSSGRHTGADFAAPAGSSVQAAVPGTVIQASWGGAYGNLVKVQHDDGTVGYYAHLSGFGVKPGQKVQRGSFLGRVGSTGNSTGPHLHFEIRRNGSSVNPLGWLQADYRSAGSHAGFGALAGIGGGAHTTSVETREFLEAEPEPIKQPAQSTEGGGFLGTEFDLDKQLETELPGATGGLSGNV